MNKTDNGDKPLKILFVCLANLCRSPMAMAMAGHCHGGAIEASSAGVSPSPTRMLPEALIVVKKLTGVDLSTHIPRHVLEFDVDGFDYLIAMDSSVFMRLSGMPRIPKDKLYGWEVSDPCGLGQDAYEKTAAQIEEYLNQFLLNREMEKGLLRRR
jgi:protein-tyrosine-phosphatase